jgi:3D (Asp-Asp-Asp) domain-containing protein
VAQSSKVEAKIKEINPPGPSVTGRPTGKVMMMVATAYSPQEPGLDDHTASGMRATKGVVAVDPRVIPLGTRLNVEGYGNCIAGDTGSAIKGNRIDVCYDTLEEMNAWGGYRTVRVEILD